MIRKLWLTLKDLWANPPLSPPYLPLSTIIRSLEEYHAGSEREQRMSDWIDVKDQVPDKKEPILYARPKARGKWSIGVAYWTASGKWNPELNSAFAPKGFTHWKAVGEPPNPPKGTEDE